MTQTILHLDSSARHEGSITRALSQEVVDTLAPAHVIRRDLTEQLPLLDATWVGANFTPADQRTADQREALALSDQLIGELEQADTLVIGAPIYNFSIPTTLKAWIDQVARAGVTFRYTENGPEGLLTGKRAIVVAASGGTPAGAEYDFATTYLRHVLGFIGITDVELIAADKQGADAEGTVRQAKAAIAALAA